MQNKRMTCGSEPKACIGFGSVEWFTSLVLYEFVFLCYLMGFEMIYFNYITLC